MILKDTFKVFCTWFQCFNSQPNRKHKQPNEAELQRFEQVGKDIALNEKELSKLVSSADKIETDIKELQEKILEIGGIKFRTQKAVVDGINEQITSLNERASKLKVERATREKNLAKVKKAVDSKSAEIQEIQEQLETIKANLAEQVESAVDIRERVKEAKKVLSDKEIVMEELKEKMNSNTEIVNEIRRNQVSRMDTLMLKPGWTQGQDFRGDAKREQAHQTN